MKDELLMEILKYVELTLVGTEDGGYYVDLNTGMKSHAHLYLEGVNKGLVKMRYGGEEKIDFEQPVQEVLKDLCSVVANCTHGRDFMSSGWEQLLVNQGFLEVKEEVIKTYRKV